MELPAQSNQSIKNKIKVSDPSKLKTMKTLFDDKLLETNSEINKEDILRIFSGHFQDETELDNFQKVVENLKEDTLLMIKKRIKTQYKKTHKFISKIIEEEKFMKDSETKIVKEDKKLELEKQVEERMTGLKQLVSKQSDSLKKLENFYFEKITNFFEANK
jgi:hypothetical protein